jgi:hypothetical protein
MLEEGEGYRTLSFPALHDAIHAFRGSEAVPVAVDFDVERMFHLLLLLLLEYYLNLLRQQLFYLPHQ